MEGQGPNLVVQWVVTQDPGGHLMMGQTHASQGLLLSKTASSSPADEGLGQHEKQYVSQSEQINNTFNLSFPSIFL